MKCGGGANLEVDPGFWTYEINSLDVYQCMNQFSCPGGSEAHKCAEGYEGKLCSVCQGQVGEA
jgi:hypothetical protein